MTAAVEKTSKFSFADHQADLDRDKFGNLDEYLTEQFTKIDTEGVAGTATLSSSALMDLDDHDGDEEMLKQLESGERTSSLECVNEIHELLKPPTPDLRAALEVYEVKMQDKMIIKSKSKYLYRCVYSLSLSVYTNLT